MKGIVSKDISLELKALGFNVRCTHYYEGEKLKANNNVFGWDFNNSFLTCCSAPHYQQVFAWFRDEHGIGGYVRRGSDKMHEHLKENGFVVADYEWSMYKTDGTYTSGRGMKETYEEAELTCIKKLIEIVKNG